MLTIDAETRDQLAREARSANCVVVNSALMLALLETAKLARTVALLERYGDGPNELGDSEDAALVINGLIAAAESALVIH